MSLPRRGVLEQVLRERLHARVAPGHVLGLVQVHRLLRRSGLELRERRVCHHPVFGQVDRKAPLRAVHGLDAIQRAPSPTGSPASPNQAPRAARDIRGRVEVIGMMAPSRSPQTKPGSAPGTWPSPRRWSGTRARPPPRPAAPDSRNPRSTAPAGTATAASPARCLDPHGPSTPAPRSESCPGHGRSPPVRCRPRPATPVHPRRHLHPAHRLRRQRAGPDVRLVPHAPIGDPRERLRAARRRVIAAVAHSHRPHERPECRRGRIPDMRHVRRSPPAAAHSGAPPVTLKSTPSPYRAAASTIASYGAQTPGG